MEVLRLMQKIVREQDQTLVMVTHDNNLASYATGESESWTAGLWESRQAAGKRYMRGMQRKRSAMRMRANKWCRGLTAFLAASMLAGMYPSSAAASDYKLATTPMPVKMIMFLLQNHPKGP